MNPLPRIAFLLVVLCAACGTGGRAQAAAPPAPAPIPAPPPPVILSEPAWRMLRVCVVDREGMREVPVQVGIPSGDTMIDGRRFSEVYPRTGDYAAGAQWYVDNGPIVMAERRYTKYGVPRRLRPEEVVPGRDHRGVMTFRSVDDADDPPGVVYVAVSPDCALQPYQWDLMTAGVRG